MKWCLVSYFCVSILLLEILNSFSVEGLALPANPKRKSKNVLTENSDQANSDHNSDLIPIPDNLLKKPTSKKVHGKTDKKVTRFSSFCLCVIKQNVVNVKKRMVIHFFTSTDSVCKEAYNYPKPKRL